MPKVTIPRPGIPVKWYVARNGQRYSYPDLSGMRFGSWTVQSRTRVRYKDGSHWMWVCKCVCGKIRRVFSVSLIGGKTTRCSTCYGKNQRIVPYSQIWSQIQAHARDRNLEVSVTREHAFSLLEQQNYLCALTGLPIKIAESRTAHNVSRDTTASLDRIDSSLGYVEGNIWWVHKEVNIMKHKSSLRRFVQLCHLVASKFPLESLDE